MPCPLPRTLVVLAALLALLPAPLSAQPAASEDGGGDEPTINDGDGPGFTALTTLIALLGGRVMMWRRNQ